jgi:hypothetical protein
VAEHDWRVRRGDERDSQGGLSKTLTRAERAGSRIADGDLAEDIDRLEREPGGVIRAMACR